MVHGEDGLQLARECTNALYSKDPHAVRSLNNELWTMLVTAMPRFTLPRPTAPVTVGELARRSKLFRNDTECVDAIKSGGFVVNGSKFASAGDTVADERLFLECDGQRRTLMRKGKRNFAVIEWK